ncbi:hypothetical protein CcrBL47_gp406 [Caulobacter phage BL47]|nr:hypothetical protein CcrBL47_gp406 [Caulobacter phage BL47]
MQRTITARIIELTSTIANPSYDRRCRYGIGAIEKYSAGSRLVFKTLQVEDEPTEYTICTPGDGLNWTSDRKIVDAVRAASIDVEPQSWIEWCATTDEIGRGIDMRVLEILYHSHPEIVKSAHADAVARYDEFQD